MKLILENFQSHRNTEIPFEHFTVLMGISNSGKSAIIRGLQWLVFNRPTGNSFINTTQMKNGKLEGYCKVVLELDELTKIVRYKDAKENCYRIYKGKKVTSYEAIKTDVPEEVYKLLPLNQLNFQSQRDVDFLISLSDGESSRYIRQLCGLERLTDILKMAKTTIREVESLKKNTANDLQRCTDHLNNFRGFDKLHKKIENLEQGENKQGDRIAEITQLQKLERNINECKERLKIFIGFDDLENLCVNYEKKKMDCIKIGNQLDKLETLQKEKSKAEEVLTGLSRLSQLEAKIENAKAINADLTAVKSKLENLRALKSISASALLFKKFIGFDKLEEQFTIYTEGVKMLTEKKKRLELLTAWRKEYKFANADLKDVMEELKTMNLCPTCGQPTG
ncbi:AAA family ATPase [Treponema sp. R6D11]